MGGYWDKSGTQEGIEGGRGGEEILWHYEKLEEVRDEVEGGGRLCGEKRGEREMRLWGCDRDIKDGVEVKTGIGRARQGDGYDAFENCLWRRGGVTENKVKEIKC